jgi:hypothetical protein
VGLVRIKPHTVAIAAAIDSDALVIDLVHTMFALGALQVVFFRVELHVRSLL